MAWRNPNVVRIGLVLCALGYLYALGLISFTINNETQTGSQRSLQEQQLRQNEIFNEELLSQIANLTNEINKTHDELLRRVKLLEEKMERGLDNTQITEISKKLEDQQEILQRAADTPQDILSRLDDLSNDLKELSHVGRFLPPYLPPEFMHRMNFARDAEMDMFHHQLEDEEDREPDDAPHFDDAAPVYENNDANEDEDEPVEFAQDFETDDEPTYHLEENHQPEEDAECQISDKEGKIYSDCKSKMNFVEQNWQSDDCYKQYGVDGSKCSVRKYMSEVEPFCPLMKDREKRAFEFEVKKPSAEEREWTNDLPRYSDLMAILMKMGPKKKYEWVEKRITSMWEGWASAVGKLNLSRRRKKKILVHLGLLTDTPGGRFSAGTGKGGPLGELVQWSDVITVLYLLGHEVTITSDVSDMLNYLSKTQFLYLPCREPQNDKFYVDLIYTDIFGFKQIEERLEHKVFGTHRCVFRLVDSFGTEPMFNLKTYAESKKIDRFWGSCNLNPKQFFTLFPHSPDNSFMGFAVAESQHQNYSHKDKKHQALVYGKQPSMWEGHSQYISVVHSVGLEIHGTVYLGKGKGSSKIPGFVHNHGVLSTADVRALLRDSKIFLGMGFPYEGPAPLEALAEGCVFFNAKLNPPHSALNTQFFEPKPTYRKLASQLPYLESIGPPNVQTLYIHDIEEVKKAVDEALKAIESGQVERMIPREFTEAGMIERVNAYVENQDFCSKDSPLWPPQSESRVFAGKKGTSCTETCQQHGYICEPAHFPGLNNVPALQKYLGNCSSTGSGVNHLYPARHKDHQTCYLQNEQMLFSCAGEDEQFERLCPCRTFIKHQIALCQSCL